MEKKKQLPLERVDMVLPGELCDEDPRPRMPRMKNKKLEEQIRRSMENWLK